MFPRHWNWLESLCICNKNPADLRARALIDSVSFIFTSYELRSYLIKASIVLQMNLMRNNRSYQIESV
jgi:hypothetical protein